MRQIIQPNLSTTDSPGWCLRFVGNSYDTKPRPFDRARKAWEGAKFKHMDALPGDVAVPVFFSWWGTIDGEYDNWGDVAIWVPGKGVFGTPQRGGGNSNRWDSSVEARRAWLGGKYPDGRARPAEFLGWTEDLNGIRLVEPSPAPTPAPAPQPAGGMTKDQEANAYRIVLGREMEHGGSGRPAYDFIVGAKPELDAQRKAAADKIKALEIDLEAERNKPPREVIKEVRVEVPVEKIVEKEVVKEVPKVIWPNSNELAGHYPLGDLVQAALTKLFGGKKG